MRFRLIKREVGAPRRLPAPPPPEPEHAPPRAADLDSPMAGITGRRGAGKTCENDPIEESHPPDGR